MTPKALWARLALAIVVPAALVTATLFPILSAHLETRIDVERAGAEAMLGSGHESLNTAINESLNHVLATANAPTLKRYLDSVYASQTGIQDLSGGTPGRQLEALFSSLMTHYGRYTEIVLVDNQGNEVIRASERDVLRGPVSHAGTERYIEGSAGSQQDLYVSAPRLAEGYDSPLVDIATPVFNTNGSRMGMLLFRLDWHQLTARLQRVLAIQENASPLMIDAEGRWLLPSTKGQPEFGSNYVSHNHEVWRGMEHMRSGEVAIDDLLIAFKTHDIRTDHYQSQAGMITSPSGNHPWRLGVMFPKPGLTSLLTQEIANLLFGLLIYLLAIAFGVYWVLSHHRQMRLREQAQRHASEAHEYAWQVRDLYENAPCGYHSLDGSGRVVKMNSTELEWLGYKATEVIGTASYRDFVSPETLEAFEEAFQAVQGSKQEGSAECELVTKTGKCIPVIIQASAYNSGKGFVHSRAMVYDLTDRKAMEAILERQALTDPLTGLGNRRFLEDQATMEIARASRRREPLSLIAIDLDLFKQLNDTYGHDVGDIVLQAFADTASGVLRDGDVLARTGGEEFTVLLPMTANEQAVKVAERLRASIESSPAHVGEEVIEGGLLHFTASLGVSEIMSADDGLKSALKRADRHLYEAKEMGRNRVSSQQPNNNGII